MDIIVRLFERAPSFLFVEHPAAGVSLVVAGVVMAVALIYSWKKG